jgi:hypothetical protein
MTERRCRTGEPLDRRRSDQGIAWVSLIAIVAAIGSAGLVANQSGVSPARAPQSGTQIFRTFSPAIAVIEATGANGSVLRFGSAVWLGQRQVLVTNAHVVVGPGRIGARFGSESFPPSELDVLYVDTGADLAVLKLARVPGRMPVVQLRTSKPPEIGEKVWGPEILAGRFRRFWPVELTPPVRLRRLFRDAGSAAKGHQGSAYAHARGSGRRSRARGPRRGARGPRPLN